MKAFGIKMTQKYSNFEIYKTLSLLRSNALEESFINLSPWTEWAVESCNVAIISKYKSTEKNKSNSTQIMELYGEGTITVHVQIMHNLVTNDILLVLLEKVFRIHVHIYNNFSFQQYSIYFLCDLKQTSLGI